jgi:hypothetical protein
VACGTGLQPVKGDLETILLKSLEKDRAERYAGVADFAADIRRYLNREPISARPPTRWTRAIRWVTRHPFVVTGSVCLVIALATLAVASLVVWYRTIRPDHIVRYRDGAPLPYHERFSSADEARLMSSAGNELHRWGSAVGAITFAELVVRPARFGGGRVAVVGHGPSDPGPNAKSVCVYEVDADRNKFVWQSGIEKGEVLPKLVQRRQIDAEHFGPCAGVIADVFPGDDHPGDEIVVTFSTRYSHRLIRIYDLGGKLLFEAWHDGDAGGCEWIAEAGLLIFAGDDQRCGWDDDGNATSPEAAPLVAFAIRPIPGSINREDYLNSDETLATHKSGTGPAWLAWYKWFYMEGDEPVRMDAHSATIGSPTIGSPRRFVQTCIVVKARSGTYDVSWEVDAFGNEAPGTRIIGGNYKLARADGQALPDPYKFQLRDDQPPLVPTTRPAQ